MAAKVEGVDYEAIAKATQNYPEVAKVNMTKSLEFIMKAKKHLEANETGSYDDFLSVMTEFHAGSKGKSQEDVKSEIEAVRQKMKEIFKNSRELLEEMEAFFPVDQPAASSETKEEAHENKEV